MMNDLQLELSARLRAARKTAGFKTVQEFSKSQKMPISTYSQYETGRRKIPEQLLQEFSKIMKVNYEWLAHGEGTPYKNKSHELRAKTFVAETLGLNIITDSIPLISEKILAAILEYLLVIDKKITPKKLAATATIIYSEIIKTEGNFETQLKAVKPVIKTFLRLTK